MFLANFNDTNCKKDFNDLESKSLAEEPFFSLFACNHSCQAALPSLVCLASATCCKTSVNSSTSSLKSPLARASRNFCKDDVVCLAGSLDNHALPTFLAMHHMFQAIRPSGCLCTALTSSTNALALSALSVLFKTLWITSKMPPEAPESSASSSTAGGSASAEASVSNEGSSPSGHTCCSGSSSTGACSTSTGAAAKVEVSGTTSPAALRKALGVLPCNVRDAKKQYGVVTGRQQIAPTSKVPATNLQRAPTLEARRCGPGHRRPTAMYATRSAAPRWRGRKQGMRA
mmetsp:Transcript_46203/g.148344  ORF Transcript_46203/g.148344 Transcript_46203/m.148344 type:complete len:287 (+) Transcript_46203:450-1310(+)